MTFRQPLLESSPLSVESPTTAQVLRSVVAGTARNTQDAFFASLVRSLADALAIDHCFVAEVIDGGKRIATLAFWSRDRFFENFQWDLAGTPCAAVIEGEARYYPAQVQALFPEDTDLVKLKVESYAGVPVRGDGGAVVGHLALMHGRGLPPGHPDFDLLELFAARAGAEFERRKTTSALRLAEARLRQVIDLVPHLIFAKDLEGRFLLANKAVSRAYGIAAPRLIGKTDEELDVRKRDLQPAQPVDPNLTETFLKMVSEEQLIDASGRVRVLQTVQLPYVSAGTELPAILGVSTDITEIRRSEERLRSIVEGTAATTGQEFFRSLVHHLADALKVDVAVVSAVQGKLLKTSAVSLDGRPGANFDYPIEGSPCQSVLETRQVVLVGSAARIVFPCFQLLVDLSIEGYLGAPLIDSEGKAMGVLAVLSRRPIEDSPEYRYLFTIFASRAAAELERQLIEEQRRQLQQQILHVQKLESLGVLAGGIAHDFNNLLAAIMGNASLASMQLSHDRKSLPLLQEIEKAAQRSAELVRQMLAYAGKGSFIVGKVDVNDIAREMAGLLRASISKKARFELGLSAHALTISADATQIGQVVMNLITNASEALHDDGGEILLLTEARELIAIDPEAYLPEPLTPGRYAVLEVRDTGSGMDAATRERLFDPFFSTKQNGRGLGLSALLGIVRTHRGAVAVDSTPGRGSTFTIFLPLAEAETCANFGSGAGQERGQDKERVAEQLVGLGQILVVDDEEPIRVLAERMLARLGHQVLTAADGLAAIEVVRGQGDGIGVVLLDMAMPRLDGRETLFELRRLRPDLKIILSSGFGEEAASELVHLPGVSFLRKPYRPQELFEKLREIASKNGC